MEVTRDLELVRELDLRLAYVLDTHVHADHVTGAARIREQTGARTVASLRGPPCADVQVSPGDVIRAGSVSLTVLPTPGHTDDSVSYLAKDRVFTGDALLIRAAGRTDFQNGDAGQLYDTITGVLFALPEATLVFPAHDYRGRTVTTIGEEKRWNTRIAGRSRDAFIAHMNGLHLPPPKHLGEAVPANRACGNVPMSVQG